MKLGKWIDVLQLSFKLLDFGALTDDERLEVLQQTDAISDAFVDTFIVPVYLFL